MAGDGAVNLPSLLEEFAFIGCGVFGPGVELGVHGLPDGVGGLYEPGVAGFPMDIGDASAVSTERRRLGGGPGVPEQLMASSSCLISCLIGVETGFHEALESKVTSSTSVLRR